MKRLFLLPIRFYRKYISPAKGAPCCRFTPTCSAYAYRAISEWGVIIGLIFSIFRILRCNPLFKGGNDPIPRRKRKLIPKTEVFGKAAKRKEEEIRPPYLMLYGRIFE